MYLDAWLDPTAPKTVSGLSRHINVPRRTIQDWLRRAEFQAWFASEVERETEHLWQPLLHRTAQLAMQGSVEHGKLLAQIRGAIRHPEDQGGGARSGVTVVIGVPRAGEPVLVPADEPRPALPPAPGSGYEEQ